MEKKKTIIRFALKTLIFFGLMFVFLYFSLILIDRFIEKELNRVEKKAGEIVMNENIFRCEVQYKDVNYKGICTEGVLEAFGEIWEADYAVQAIKVCGNTPYAYRMAFCKKYAGG